MEDEEIQKGKEAFAALASSAKRKTGCATAIMGGAALLFSAYMGFQFGRAAMKADTVGVGGFFWGNVSSRNGTVSVPLGTLHLETNKPAETPADPEPKAEPGPKSEPKPESDTEEGEVGLLSVTPSLAESLTQVKNGMTYRQVCALLGKPVKSAQMHNSASSRMQEPDLKVYTWGTGPQALVVFERGMVIGKQHRN